MNTSLAASTGFSNLELRVVRLAASSREPAGGGRAREMFDRVFGFRRALPLADPRLEALRRQSLAVRAGTTGLNPDFVAAGYSAAVIERIAGIVRREAPAARRDRLTYAGGVTLGLGAIAGFLGLTASLLVL